MTDPHPGTLMTGLTKTKRMKKRSLVFMMRMSVTAQILDAPAEELKEEECDESRNGIHTNSRCPYRGF